MTKITVESLAKQLKVSSSDVLKALESLGVFVPSAKAPLEWDEIKRVCVKLTGKEPRIRSKSSAPAQQGEGKNAAAAGKPAKPRETAAAEAPAAEAPAPEAKPAAADKPAEEKPAAPVKAEKPAEQTAPAKPAEEPVPEEKKTPAAVEEPAAAAPKAEQPAEAVKPAAEKDSQPRAAKPAAQNPGEPRQGQKAGERPAKPQTPGGIRQPRVIIGPNGERLPAGQVIMTAPTGRKERPARQGQGQGQGSQGQSGQGAKGPRTERSQGSSRSQGEGRPERQGQGSRPQGQGTARGTGRTDRPGTGTGRPAQPAARTRKEDLSIPEAPKEVTAQTEKPKKSDRMRRDKDKEKERAKMAASDNFGRRHNKNLVQMDEEDENVRSRGARKNRPAVKSQEQEEDQIKVVQLPPVMTVREFADAVKKPVTQIIKSLMLKGKMMGQNDDIEYDLAEELALGMDILAEPMKEEDIFKEYLEREDAPETLKPRPPVVVVMGHVDHGKTSLLDYIRNTKVTAGEAGGITQHIGASIVPINGHTITFLDTPGHEAFTAMRMRGAMVTDIAILVVAADDGIMPQTVEAINHAKAAGVQIIVAINKMDKPEANPDHVKQQLTEYALIPEEWGGSTICVPVSAKTGMGIDTLLEMVLLVADMQELKANPDRPAEGHVIEAQLDKGRGVVATCLVQKGTLHIGDSIVVGKAFGRIKAMNDDKGKKTKAAGPSMAVEIQGLSEVPVAGEQFFVTPSEREARLLSEKVSARDREKLLEGTKKVSLETLFEEIQAGEVKTLNIIVKADVQGSVEAVKQSLEKLSTDKVALHVIHGAVGAIAESDVMLASASNSIIIGFNVRPDAGAKAVAEQEKVDVRLYRVIYDAIEDIRKAMEGLLEPEFVEKVNGHATVRQVFKASGVGTIAGSYVTDGKIARGSKARLVRDGIVIYEGEIASLRRFKDDAKEVATGYECGITLKDYSDIKEDDVIESFVMEEVKRTL
ncbi:MAG: translation initiation factor IF-2 [Firmicutes bacterium]|nr:translation initiation factor IF-2 [Bacillota bacterium]